MDYFDAHLHIVQCFSYETPKCLKNFFSVSCSHSKDEFLKQEKLISSLNLNSASAFGLHPQNPGWGGDIHSNADFLSSLLEEKRICAIGECGFDLFTDEYKLNFENQRAAWEICLDLALKFNKPIIVHDRKALDILFTYARDLKKLPSVIFHSFAFGPREAQSLLDHGIRGYFSFGNALIKGNKKSISSFSILPEESLLLETDAPYQTLWGQEYTPLGQIEAIYNKAAEIRGWNLEKLGSIMEKNFFAAYNISRASFTAS